MALTPATVKLDRLQRQKVYFETSGVPTTQMQIHWQRTMEAIEKAFFDLSETIEAVIETQEGLAQAQEDLEATQAELTTAVADIAAAQEAITIVQGDITTIQTDLTGVALQTSLDATNAALAELEGSTGWAVYNHGGGAQSLATSTRTQLSIDGATKIESQLPLDTGPLWDTATDTITGRTGDGIVCKIQCIFTPSDAMASEVLFDVDIGGGVGIVEYQTFAATKGSGMAHYVSWTFAAYTMSTWLANGGKIYATADGPGDITALRIVVQRTHKAR